MRDHFLLFFLFPLCLCACPEGFFNNTVRCCRLCPAGTFLLKTCTLTQEPQCQSCKDGEFSDQPNKDTQCKPCMRSCNVGQVVVESCNRTRDMKCSCPDGKYLIPGLIFCDECKQCKPGQGAVVPCQGSNNSQCQDCVRGVTFSSTTSHRESCQACTQCRGKTLQNCTLTSDSVCEKVEITDAPTSPVTTASIKVIKSSQEDSKEPPQYIYVIAGVVAAVVIVFIVIFALCRQFNKRGQNSNTPDSSEADREGDVVSIHVNDDVKVIKVKMVRDLPGHVIMAIEEKLNPDGPHNWIQLAERLGATQLEIANFKLVPEKATQKVIQSWCVKESATVEELCRALNDIKRHDCLAFVKPYSILGKPLKTV